jgi:nucleoside-diphosphate-sugar epimerase
LQQSGLRYSILRPALVYGQYDNTDRLYYWLYQIKGGYNLLIPNRGESLFSVTYVKDLVKAIIGTLSEELESDIYNITTYPKLSISKLISTTIGIIGKQPKTYTVDSRFLKRNVISEWTDLPLWLDGDYFTFDNTKMIGDLRIELTNFDISVKETTDYYEKLGWKEPKYGISEKTKNALIVLLMNNNNR